MSRRLARLRSRRIDYVVSASVLGLAIVLSIWSVPSTFSLSAQTESIRFTTGESPVPSWQLKDVSVFNRGPREGSSKFTGSLSLGSGVDVEIERISGGPLKIECRARPGPYRSGAEQSIDQQTVAMLTSTDEQSARAVKGRLIMRVDDIEQRAKSGDSLLLAMVGDIVLGGNGLQAAPLRSGTVLILGKTLVRNELFEGGRAILEVGDVFSTPRPVGAAVGFVLADERPALTASFRVVATEGEVFRFASQGYKIGLTPLGRIKSDLVIQGFYIAAVFIFGVLRIVIGRPFKPEAQK